MDTHVGRTDPAGDDRKGAQEVDDFVHTGPDTLAGRYLRRFWQPIHLSKDLKAGWSVPIRVLSQDLTLYRGEGGAPFAVGHKCAHRGVQLSAGIVEGDCIRCPYHGWQYDGTGQCTEQPSTPNSFAHKVRIPSFPAVDRLGMIFVYLGEGKAPPPPHYPLFENAGGLYQHMNVLYDHNYFHHLENAIDEAHIPVLHRLSPYEVINFEVPRISAEETAFGIAQYGTRSTGVKRATYFHMPNMSSWAQHPIYPEESAWREWMAWRVPVDDHSHRTIGVMHAHVPSDSAATFLEHRRAEFEGLAKFPPTNDVADAVLAGKMRWRDIELRGPGTDMTLIQDRVAMLGQGVIADRVNETLGSNDVAIMLLRTLWRRELQALRDGRPLKQWAPSIPLCTSGL
jgi:5,5'-dehydrodivanillate O-demethylase